MYNINKSTKPCKRVEYRIIINLARLIIYVRVSRGTNLSRVTSKEEQFHKFIKINFLFIFPPTKIFSFKKSSMVLCSLILKSDFGNKKRILLKKT